MIEKGLLDTPRLTTTQRDAISLAATDATVIFNTSTGFHEAWNGTAWVQLTHSLAVADQTLTGRRLIVTDGAATDLRIQGLEANSDRQSAWVLTVDNNTWTMKRRKMESILFDISSSGPVNGTTIGWYDGYMFLNSTTNELWRATTKSTNPDVSGAGSIWEKITSFDNYVHTFTLGDWSSPSGGNRTITILGTAHLRGNSPIVQVFQITGGTTATEIALQGLSHNTSTGDITLTVIDGQEFAGRAVIRG